MVNNEDEVYEKMRHDDAKYNFIQEKKSLINILL